MISSLSLSSCVRALSGAALSALTLMLCLSPRPALAQSGGYNVSGFVTLEGCITPAISAQNVTFYFASTDNPYSFTRTAYLASNGSFTIPNVPADTYQLHIKGTKWLASVQPVNTTTGNATGVTATLLAGDANNDNSIDPTDFNIFVSAYNSDSSIPGSGYDTQADFNCDGLVDPTDFSLFVSNYTLAGDLKPTPAIVATNLTLSVTGVKAGTGLTGTVTISAPAPTGGAILLLSSGNSAALLVASVTVPAGQTTGTFPILTDPNVSEPVTATISVSSGHWTQAAPLSVVPVGYNLSIQNLSVDPAKGAILLDWKELPEGSVKGYFIYRRTGNGAFVPLYSTPITAAVYVDNNVTNGTTYAYQVTVVDANGNESPRTAAMNAKPLATLPAVAWLSYPMGPAITSGLISLYASSPVGSKVSTVLLVDGKIVSHMDKPNTAENPYSGSMQADLDTVLLLDGTHTVQIVGYVDGTQAVVSPVVTFQTGNSLGGFNNSGIVEIDTSEFASFDISAPTGTQMWQAELRDSSGTAVTTWQSTSPQIKLTWAGTDTFGNQVQDGNYTIDFTAMSQGGMKQREERLIKINSSPVALSLIRYPYPEIMLDVDNSNTTRYYIQGIFDTMKVNNPGFSGLSLISNIVFPKQLRRWLVNSVDIFHLSTHGHYGDAGGVADYATWNNFTFRPGHMPPTTKALDDTSLDIYISDVVQREYSFVFLDFCHSGGGGNIVRNSSGDITDYGDRVSTPKYDWAHAFGINSDGLDDTETGLFWGWNGTSGSTFIHRNNPVSSSWYYWELSFWGYILNNNIIDAGSKATSDTQKFHFVLQNILPWDRGTNGEPRALISGDGLKQIP